MADKLVSGQDGGLGGFAQIALPIGLGVAAAAHPALARGASAITSSMGQFQKNRRLREVMEMEKTEQARKMEAHKAAMEEQEYQKGQRPIKEQKGRYLGAVATGGGGHKALQIGQEGGIVTSPINEDWVGSKAWEEAQRKQKGIDLDKQLEYLRHSTEAQRSLQQSGHALTQTQPPTPQQALTLRQHIMEKIEDQVMKFANSDFYPDEDQIQQYRWRLHKQYQPDLQHLEGYIPGVPKTTLDQGPPAGYIKHPKVPNAWYNPKTLEFWTP